MTNYPIGVGINLAGDIVVADNHNNFNLTVFNQVLFYLNFSNAEKITTIFILIKILFSFFLFS